MTKVEIDSKTVEQIRAGEGPIELIDLNGQTVGVVRRPPTDEEIERAKDRASHGGETLNWVQFMAKVRSETGE